MSIALDITGTSQPGGRVALRAGQVATVGRSPWADISLPSEPELAAEHFRLDCRHTACRVESLGGTVLRNGMKTDSAILVDGDLLAAGRVQFHVRIFGLTQDCAEAAPLRASHDGTAADRSPVAEEFAGVVERAGLSPEGRECLIVGDRLGTLDGLLAAGLQKDACRFAVACLPPVVTIEWAFGQLKETAGLSHDEREQLLSYVSHESDAWTADELDVWIAARPPNAVGTWLGKAARWSRGSLTGAGLPPVPPAPHLFAVALSVVVSLAAAQQEQDVFVDWMASAREQIDALTQPGRTEVGVQPSGCETSEAVQDVTDGRIDEFTVCLGGDVDS